MSVIYKRIEVRASNGHQVQGQPPLAVRMLALELEGAVPEYVYYPEEASTDEVYVLLLQAAMAKVSHVQTAYTFNPNAGTGLATDHVIDTANPALWTDIGGSTLGIVHPIVAPDQNVYYIGFSI